MRNVILLLLFTSTLGLTSCKKDTIIQNVPSRTIFFNIVPSSWVSENGGRVFYTDLEIPENNAQFNQSGGILASISFDSNREVFDALPSVVDGFSYTFTSEPGYVRFYIEDVNGNTITPPAGNIRAKIVLIDSEIID